MGEAEAAAGGEEVEEEGVEVDGDKDDDDLRPSEKLASETRTSSAASLRAAVRLLLLLLLLLPSMPPRRRLDESEGEGRPAPLASEKNAIEVLIEINQSSEKKKARAFFAHFLPSSPSSLFCLSFTFLSAMQATLRSASASGTRLSELLSRSLRARQRKDGAESERGKRARERSGSQFFWLAPEQNRALFLLHLFIFGSDSDPTRKMTNNSIHATNFKLWKAHLHASIPPFKKKTISKGAVASSSSSPSTTTATARRVALSARASGLRPAHGSRCVHCCLQSALRCKGGSGGVSKESKGGLFNLSLLLLFFFFLSFFHRPPSSSLSCSSPLAFSMPPGEPLSLLRSTQQRETPLT